MSVVYKVLASMDIEMRRQESISRNLAGSQIPGYKGETVLSSDFDGFIDRYSIHGQGTILGDNHVSFDSGPLKHTGRPLDFALSGNGFFEITTPDGDTLYSRNGRFLLSPSGEIQTIDGFKLEASVGNFQLNDEEDVNELFVKDDGNVAVGIGLRERELGRIKVVNFDDLKNLERVSSSYYKLPDKFQNTITELDPGEFNISGRTLENANITPVKEMITMIDSMRKYEMAQRLMKMRNGLSQKEYQTFGS